MKKIKKIISASLLFAILFSFTGNVNAFKHMDVCNSTNGDSSGNYYDGLCTTDGVKSDNTDSNTTDNKEELTNTGSNVTINNSKKVSKKKEYNLKHTDIKIKHSVPWLMTREQRNATKDRQLCKTASSFDILDKDGIVIDTYYPQGCQTTNYTDDGFNPFEEESNSINLNITEENPSNDGIDDFIENIFSEEDNIDETKLEETSEEGIETIDDMYSETILDTSTDSVDTDTGSTEDFDDAEDILKDIFNTGYIKTKTLKGSKYARTLKDFQKEKLRIKVGSVKANVIKSSLKYDSNVANLLNKVDNEFKIDSIKNSLAKNISNVSFSLYTYKNTTDTETKEVFRNKLINDLKTLKKKYKILKRKDFIISATLEKRGQL